MKTVRQRLMCNCLMYVASYVIGVIIGNILLILNRRATVQKDFGDIVRRNIPCRVPTKSSSVSDYSDCI